VTNPDPRVGGPSCKHWIDVRRVRCSLGRDLADPKWLRVLSCSEQAHAGRGSSDAVLPNAIVNLTTDHEETCLLPKHMASVSTDNNMAPGQMWAVLLAGGDGIRLRDLTRRITGDSRPKQFCPILGGKSLFHRTRERVAPLFHRDRQIFVLSRAHERYNGDLADTSDSCVIAQPLNRGTGIAIILALVHVLRRDPDAIVGFFPCDHYYSDEQALRLTVQSAAASAAQCPESIVLVGAEAGYPETEYGWIEPGVLVSQSPAGPLSTVNRFWEKPAPRHARALLKRGCLWNTFVIVGRAATFLSLSYAQLPETVRTITRAVADGALESAYNTLPAVDFSRDIVANEPRRLLALRDRTSGWADLGSPARVLATLTSNSIQPEWVRQAKVASYTSMATPG
jgi:mannose-1-phosphate guanylyltransferase